MINPSAAWQRLHNAPMFSGLELKDFRPITYVGRYELAASAELSTQRQEFPSGAIILGVTAGAVEKGQAFVNAGSNGGRNSFALSFAYSNDESITPGGFVMAEALLGAGQQSQFPPREIIVVPSAGILVSLQNLTTSILNVHVAWHCLTWRYAS